MSAYGMHNLIQAERLMNWANIIAAISFDAFDCVADPLNEHIHAVRSHNGQVRVAKKLRELLAANAHLPMNEQKNLLETLFIEWKGNNEQVDDVCLIGVRI